MEARSWKLEVTAGKDLLGDSLSPGVLVAKKAAEVGSSKVGARSYDLLSIRIYEIASHY